MSGSQFGNNPGTLAQLGGVAIPDVTNGITATASGTQVTSLILSTKWNRITTVASGNDSVRLPPAIAALTIVVVNAAASNSAKIWPSPGDAINALGADAALTLAANKLIEFRCLNDGQWHTNLTA